MMGAPIPPAPVNPNPMPGMVMLVQEGVMTPNELRNFVLEQYSGVRNFHRWPLVGNTVREPSWPHGNWIPSRGNVTTYTLPQPKHWLRWIIFATAVGVLASAMLSYLN